MKISHNPRGVLAAIAFGLAFAVFPAASSAQISLSTVVELAQRNSSAVKLAEADLQKAQTSLIQAKDVYIPNLTIGSTVGYSIGFPTGQPSIANASTQSLAFSFPQQQYIKAARAGVQAASLGLKDAREQVALDASTAYVELNTVTQERKAAQEQAGFAERLVSIEQERSDAGVDPLSELLQAKLTAAQIKLKLVHLETRANTLASQLAALTGLPASSMATDGGSIPQIPAVTADAVSPVTSAIQSAQALSSSKRFQAKGDELAASWWPIIGFGAQYNLDSDALNDYSRYFNKFTPNNVAFGFSILVPVFDIGRRSKAKESAADLLRASVEAEQAQRQNDVQIATISGNLRELDALAEIASLKQQIAAEQLKAVQSQLEFGNGAGAGPGSPPQLTPKAEQLAHISERKEFIDALDASSDLSKARLSLLRALGHMDDWLRTLSPAPPQNK